MKHTFHLLYILFIILLACGVAGAEVTKSPSTETSISVSVWLEINTVAPGDINDDHSVDLSDAILSNQILCGITPAGSVHKGADVSGDGKIGPEEAIYVLQVVSGLKVVLV